MSGVPPALKKVFLKLGENKGLDKALLGDVLEHLVENQYIAMADRTHVRASLRRIIEKHEG